jgi:calcium-dependent protein kinase
MDGCIDREELIMAYEKVRKKHGGTFSPDEILRQLDTDGNGQIEYSEFLIATMDLKKALSKDNLKAAFH